MEVKKSYFFQNNYPLVVFESMTKHLTNAWSVSMNSLVKSIYKYSSIHLDVHVHGNHEEYSHFYTISKNWKRNVWKSIKIFNRIYFSVSLLFSSTFFGQRLDWNTLDHGFTLFLLVLYIYLKILFVVLSVVNSLFLCVKHCFKIHLLCFEIFLSEDFKMFCLFWVFFLLWLFCLHWGFKIVLFV